MMKTENIAVIISIVISIVALIFAYTSWSADHDLQKQMFELQRQGAQKEEAKENKPPTASLTQDFKGGDNGWYGRLEIIPTLYFRKNSKGDGHFTIFNYQANFTLNGKDVGSEPVGGYPMRYITEELPYNVPIKSSIYPTAINPINISKFYDHSNDLVINYILEVKDMDSQIVYRGNVTTELNSSIYPPKSFPSGVEPLKFEFSPLEKKK